MFVSKYSPMDKLGIICCVKDWQNGACTCSICCREAGVKTWKAEISLLQTKCNPLVIAVNSRSVSGSTPSYSPHWVTTCHLPLSSLSSKRSIFNHFTTPQGMRLLFQLSKYFPPDVHAGHFSSLMSSILKWIFDNDLIIEMECWCTEVSL